MNRYEVSGFVTKNGKAVQFKTITPPVENQYQARLYVEGKLKDMDVAIREDGIFCIFD